MLLKKLKLQNIRSYKKAEISFPEGSTLLMGDIGSGKTSVLLAIEFALFGLQPSQRGNSLLRNDEEEAFVSLEFEVEGKNVIIERKIKKTNKTISQSDASIIIDNQKYEGSITEIKNKVLTLLNYPLEFAKKTNDLYKFTVYTPQEEMKQIILEPPETRLNALRHIFGIDKYKIIGENISNLGIKLRQQIRINEVKLENIEEINRLIENKKISILEKEKKLKEFDENIKELAKKKEEIEQEIEKLDEHIKKKQNLEKETEKIEIILFNKKENVNSYEKEIGKLEKDVQEVKQFFYDEEKIASLKSRIENQEQILRSYNEEYVLIASRLQSYESKKQETFSLKSKISGLRKCPTCLQEVNEIYKSNIISNADEEINILNKKAVEENNKKIELLEKIDSLKKQIQSSKDSLSESEILKVKLQSIEEKSAKIDELKVKKRSINKEIELISSEYLQIKEKILDYGKYTKIYEEKNKEIKELNFKEHSLAIIKAETNKEIQFLEQQISDYLEKIEKVKKIMEEISYLKELESWIVNKFSQLIIQTEKNVMFKLREEFSKLFCEWFSILVAETLSVKIDESFSPIIQQQDYELDYGFLSGGERTAVALAYRLALNQVINSILSKIKTHDLVILDEPTDGFSETQLYKIRDVLQQLKVKQLILVSHEQKIEGFVDNIIRFKKNNGFTEIEQQ